MHAGCETVAANDTHFAPPRHRTLPILASVTPIANYPSKLRIYLTNASKFWQVRCFFRGKSYSQSLKTTNKRSAICAAKQFFHIKTAELYGEHVKQQPSATSTFGELVPEALGLQQARVQRGELSVASLRILQNRLHKTIIPHFGGMAIDKINYTQISTFVQQMSGSGMTTTTIQQHLVAIRKVLSYAQNTNLITTPPKFPTIKVVSKPRGGFALAEYRQLVKAARTSIGTRIPVTTKCTSKVQSSVERYAVVSIDLHWLIRFMVNSFVRPSDIKNLQHKHVTIVKGRHTYLRLNLPESKLHDKPIVTMPSAVDVYERLLAHHRAQDMGSEDDYVFMPSQLNRGKALEFLGWQFKYVQTVGGIGNNRANGKIRTLYSLRHTAITLRLLYGGKIDLLTLARNARTSVEMIERFYASELSGEMNIALLQGKRK